MYESIKAWLEGEKNPEEYDFTQEIVDAVGREDAIDRYIVYQATGIRSGTGADEAEGVLKKHEVFNKNGHADGCALIDKIYNVLWPKMLLTLCMKGKYATGETMNSVNTTMLVLLSEEIEKGWSIRKTVKRYFEEDGNGVFLKGIIQKYPHAEGFLSAAYTIGNFIPVPVGCNGPRGMGPTNDYWDLALLAIYQYFTEKKEDGIRTMLQNKEEETQRYIAWLNTFGSWDQFVIVNYMQDFVKPAGLANNGVFGEPKELWDEHFEGPAEPAPEQIEVFFARAAQCIKARSKRMVEALREKS